MSNNTHGRDVRALVEAERNGLLCTLSKKIDGWPFGSITPYALTGAGHPLILISELAEHTKNLRTDARASLLVQDASAIADPQAGARVTLMGYAAPVARPQLDDARRRYVASFPNSAGYFQVHDFSLFQLQVRRVRYIGGFGQIYWLDGRDVIDASLDTSGDPLAPHGDSICAHMNEDHADALKLYLVAFAGTEAESAEMIHVDSLGFDLIAFIESRHKHFRLDFPEPARTTEEARRVMVDMVKRARQMIAR